MCEFYALLVISPEKFLNYDNTKFIGNADWEDYLNGNIEASKRGIPQHRYFLSIKADQRHLLERLRGGQISEEAPLVFHKDVAEQLTRRYVRVENGLPVKEKREIEGIIKQKYVIEDKNNVGTLKGEWKTLAEVIGTIYHKPSCCFVREFEKDDFEKHLIHNELKKPLDYFAIKKNGDWKFCLQTLYDKSFDIANIEIFHDGIVEKGNLGRWQDVKKKLDLIFDPSSTVGERHPIEKYGCQ